MEQTLHLKDMLKCNLPGQPVIIQQNEKYRFDVIGDVTSTLSIENRLFINVTPIGMPGQPIFRWRPGTACICRYMKTPIYLMPATPELIKQCNNIRLINEQIPEYNGFKEPDTYTIQRWIYDLQKKRPGRHPDRQSHFTGHDHSCTKTGPRFPASNKRPHIQQNR